MFVRIGANATKKGQDSPEGKKLTLPEIQSKFLEAVSCKLGKPIKFGKWGHAAKPNGQEPEVLAVTPQVQIVSLSDSSNPSVDP